MEILMMNLTQPFPQSDHTRLDADSFELRGVELVSAACEFLEVDIPLQGHLARVDLKNARAGGLVGEWELDLAVETS